MKWGELFSDPRHLRGDLRLLKRAVRNDWPIPEDDRRLLVGRLDAIITSGGTVRERLAALDAVAAMETANARAILAELASGNVTAESPVAAPDGQNWAATLASAASVCPGLARDPSEVGPRQNGNTQAGVSRPTEKLNERTCTIRSVGL